MNTVIKIRKTILILLCLIVLLLCSCEADDGINAIICAHRGYHYTEKENSLNSFSEAVKHKCAWAELDVWCTADNQLVATHEKNLSRVYGKNVDVTLVTLDTLRESATKEQVPTLDDVWDIIKGKIKLQIEIKDKKAVPLILDFFERNDCYKDCIVISFTYYECLDTIKTSDSKIVCGYLADSYSSWMSSLPCADILAIQYTGIIQEEVQSIHSAGKKVYVWTVDSLNKIREMDSWGVDAITTNNPDLLSDEPDNKT